MSDHAEYQKDAGYLGPAAHARLAAREATLGVAFLSLGAALVVCALLESHGGTWADWVWLLFSMIVILSGAMFTGAAVLDIIRALKDD